MHPQRGRRPEPAADRDLGHRLVGGLQHPLRRHDPLRQEP